MRKCLFEISLRPFTPTYLTGLVLIPKPNLKPFWALQPVKKCSSEPEKVVPWKSYESNQVCQILQVIMRCPLLMPHPWLQSFHSKTKPAQAPEQNQGKETHNEGDNCKSSVKNIPPKQNPGWSFSDLNESTVYCYKTHSLYMKYSVIKVLNVPFIVRVWILLGAIKRFHWLTIKFGWAFIVHVFILKWSFYSLISNLSL